MTNFVPIFPLDIVVYPAEPLHLHIFEPRYKQLIKECIELRKPFGIPVVLDKKIQEYGTLMEITDLVKEYDNGEMDIKTKGVQVFRVLELVKSLPDKLYSGAIVNYPDNILVQEDTKLAALILTEVKRLYKLLNVEEKYPIAENAVISYSIAHFLGMKKDQEYEMLHLFTETQRLEYIRRHLNEIVPVVKEFEVVKERIKMNGHFRNLSIDDLDI
ncbi:MAG: LON peptidase substrate-binding domain-containing protein [Chitinophagales bacterium]|nr:LON peptidase substrate-binding domain-containing protein [Chitinophagaceae bacterium]MCB9064963.1 LON peptidase substrate-binding domain-containing protein [Chitinophagales bacterium]